MNMIFPCNSKITDNKYFFKYLLLFGYILCIPVYSNAQMQTQTVYIESSSDIDNNKSTVETKFSNTEDNTQKTIEPATVIFYNITPYTYPEYNNVVLYGIKPPPYNRNFNFGGFVMGFPDTQLLYNSGMSYEINGKKYYVTPRTPIFSQRPNQVPPTGAPPVPPAQHKPSVPPMQHKPSMPVKPSMPAPPPPKK